MIESPFSKIFKTWYGGEVSFSNTTWKESYKIIPTRCIASGRLILPFTKVYKGTRRMVNQGYASGYLPWNEYFWMVPEVYTYNRLKGNL